MESLSVGKHIFLLVFPTRHSQTGFGLAWTMFWKGDSGLVIGT